MILPNDIRLKDREDIAIQRGEGEYYVNLDIHYRLKSGGCLEMLTFDVYDVVYYDEITDEETSYKFSKEETEELKKLWLEKFESEAELELEKEY